MERNGGAHQRSTRVHAVILTRNRTAELRRCVNTALATLGPNDALTVIDDSCVSVAQANACMLGERAGRSGAHLTHLSAEQIHEVVARVSGGRRAPWQSKTAPRDIAPLRNVSLLLAVVVDAQTTVLIDDDIEGFDLDATHSMLDARPRGPEGVIAGAKIGGATEQDTLTRLADAMCLLERTADEDALPVVELFRVPADGNDHWAHAYRWVSAGYLAFRLPHARLFAFPPGYNEDWLWCLLHETSGETRLLRADQVVMHNPPFLRRSSCDDILFELGGDFVLDCLAECGDGRSCGPDEVLADLAQRTPHPSMMPSVRAETVLKQARELSESEHGRILSELKGYGLGVLGDMQRLGELQMDGSRMLSDWSRHAVAKQWSFTVTLETPAVRVALRAMLHEGRL